MNSDEMQLNKILVEVNNIENLFNIINDNIDYINTCRDKIQYNKGVKIDDVKFYNSLVNNCYHYYKCNTDVRLNKLSKDLKEHFRTLKSNDYTGDICFNKEIIKKMFEAYKIKKKNAHSYANDVYWIKDILYDELQEWPTQLYRLLKYHKSLLNPLKEASLIERYFFEKPKNRENLSKTCGILKLEASNKKTILTKKKPAKSKFSCFGCLKSNIPLDVIDEKDETIYKLNKQLTCKDIEIRRLKKELKECKNKLKLEQEMKDSDQESIESKLDENLDFEKVNEEVVEETDNVEVFEETDNEEVVEETDEEVIEEANIQ
jgi:uncharacterized coiled-coil protein SlyX